MLVPFLDYCFAEKQSSKKDVVKPAGTSGFKIVFALLAKIVLVKI